MKIVNIQWIYIFIKYFIGTKKDDRLIESILNKRIQIWDHGEWASKIWMIIKENNLNVKEFSTYTIDDKGQKTYNIKAFLEEQINNNFIGPNPLLQINDSFVDYPENQILETLKKKKIKDISIILKGKSVCLFGKKGINGMLIVFTK